MEVTSAKPTKKKQASQKKKKKKKQMNFENIKMVQLI